MSSNQSAFSISSYSSVRLERVFCPFLRYDKHTYIAAPSGDIPFSIPAVPTIPAACQNAINELINTYTCLGLFRAAPEMIKLIKLASFSPNSGVNPR
jgi:hypothetical protein